jgi:hypothetical protein
LQGKTSRTESDEEKRKTRRNSGDIYDLKHVTASTSLVYDLVTW